MRPTRLALVITTLGIALVGGLVAAPWALAKVGSRASLYPSATIYSGQTATLTAAAWNGGNPAANRWVLLEYSTDAKTFHRERTIALDGRGVAKLSVHPGTTTVYRLVYGNETATTSYSAWARVTVLTDRGMQVLAQAKKHIGKGYAMGAAGPGSFDCSGFTMYVMRSFGKSLPHSATAQYRYGSSVPTAQKKPGDLLFWGSGGSKYHVAIYAGNNQIIDASTDGVPVRIHRMWGSPAVRRLV
jgi:cell wall-associated NlpC family hydrolase